MGVEAVQGPVGSRLGALVLLARQKQREQSVAWVAGVRISLGLPLTPPGIEILDGEELSPSLLTTLW